MAEALLSSQTAAQKAAALAAVQSAANTPILPPSAFIDPTTGAERPLNNPVTNPQNYQTDLATGQSNAVINNKIQAINNDTTLTPAQKQTQMTALQSQKQAPVGITPDTRNAIVQQQNLPQNQAPARDVSAEQSTIKNYGLDPSNPQDAASALQITYPKNQLTAMINGGTVDASHFSAQALKDMGITPDRIQQLMNQTTDPAAKQRLQDAYTQLTATGAMGAQVESTLNATPKPTNQMMSALSDALNAKSNFKQQNLGTSDLFKMAGLSGYSVLAQSLQQRRQEMGDKIQSAQSLVSQSGSAMASTYQAIADNYNKIATEYDKQMNVLLNIDQQATQHEQALDLAKQQDQLDRQTYEWKKQVDSQYATDKTTPKYDNNGNFLGYWDAATNTFVQQPTQDQSTSTSWLGGIVSALGSISGKYESGNDYSRVSTGSGDAGGASYGSHQFSSATGSLQSFLKDSGYDTAFKGMTVGSAEFNKTWQQLAKDPQFQEAQDKEVQTKYYEPMAANLQKAGLDLSSRSQPVQEMIYSTGVQYGPNSNVIKQALKGKDVSSMTDKDIIKTVQNYKNKTVGDYFSSSSPAVQSGVKKRTLNEMNDLISMGAKIGWSTGGSVGGSAGAIGGAVLGAVGGLAGMMENQPATSFQQKYFSATNDRTIFDPNSALSKDLAQMNDAQKEQYLNGVVDKAARAAIGQ